MKSPMAGEHRPLAEMIRGAQTVMSAMQSAVLLIGTPPEEWRAEKASSLGGVIVVPQDVTEQDLDILKNRNLPYILFTETNLPGPRIILGQREAARHMTQQLLQNGHRRLALLTGYDVSLDATKRMGVHDALREAGIDPAQVPEVSANGQENEIFQAARTILGLSPRPTAIIAFDDSLGAVVNLYARRNMGLSAPKDLSVISFHDWPYLNFVEVPLTTVRFDFFNAGRSAAEALNQSALTGEPVADICFQPTYRPGQSSGPVPVDT